VPTRFRFAWTNNSHEILKPCMAWHKFSLVYVSNSLCNSYFLPWFWYVHVIIH
jgi:hypothetical protein